jgi:hypothetical protein
MASLLTSRTSSFLPADTRQGGMFCYDVLEPVRRTKRAIYSATTHFRKLPHVPISCGIWKSMPTPCRKRPTKPNRRHALTLLAGCGNAGQSGDARTRLHRRAVGRVGQGRTPEPETPASIQNASGSSLAHGFVAEHLAELARIGFAAPPTEQSSVSRAFGRIGPHRICGPADGAIVGRGPMTLQTGWRLRFSLGGSFRSGAGARS